MKKEKNKSADFSQNVLVQWVKIIYKNQYCIPGKSRLQGWSLLIWKHLLHFAYGSYFPSYAFIMCNFCYTWRDRVIFTINFKKHWCLSFSYLTVQILFLSQLLASHRTMINYYYICMSANLGYHLSWSWEQATS